MSSSVQRIGSLALGIALIAAVPAAAQQQPPAQQRPAKSISSDSSERICEDVIPTGSRLAKSRVCATRAEWEVRRRDDREVTERYQRVDLDPCRRAPSGASRPC